MLHKKYHLGPIIFGRIIIKISGNSTAHKNLNVRKLKLLDLQFSVCVQISNHSWHTYIEQSRHGINCGRKKTVFIIAPLSFIENFKVLFIIS